ncbi:MULTISPECIES: Rid family hydrolase [unclassified Paenibacillus]|uniref:Rid family hydrolase n=1 Tax=unclassified Paenibacillus TaxID=185978 RepID=UPI00362D66D1
MTERTRVFTGSPWEPVVGYCRAIRVGNRVEVAGTTAMNDGEVIGVGSTYEQTKNILKTIEEALHKVGDPAKTQLFSYQNCCRENKPTKVHPFSWETLRFS